MTASAINRQLIQLEEEVGTPLFERLSSGMQLTSAGEAFAQHVINVLQDAQRLQSELDALKGLRRGTLQVMAPPGLMATMVRVLTMRMLERYPHLNIEIDSGDSDRAAKALVDGSIDVALGFSVKRSVELRQVAVGRFAFGAVMAPDHPLANEAQVSFTQCAQHPLILATEQLSTYAVLEPVLRAYKRPYEVVAVRTGSIELTKGLAASGAGIAFQTRMGMESELASGVLKLVTLKTPAKLYSEVGVYVRSGRSLPPPADAFVRAAAEELEKQLAFECS